MTESLNPGVTRTRGSDQVITPRTIEAPRRDVCASVPITLPTADPCPGCGRTDCVALNHR